MPRAVLVDREIEVSLDAVPGHPSSALLGDNVPERKAHYGFLQPASHWPRIFALLVWAPALTIRSTRSRRMRS